MVNFQKTVGILKKLWIKLEKDFKKIIRERHNVENICKIL